MQPELETYKSIVKACLVAKEFNMALTTLFDIQTSGRRPDQETWDMLVEICALVGKWDAALEIIRDIFAEEVTLACWWCCLVVSVDGGGAGAVVGVSSVTVIFCLLLRFFVSVFGAVGIR